MNAKNTNTQNRGYESFKYKRHALSLGIFKSKTYNNCVCLSKKINRQTRSFTEIRKNEVRKVKIPLLVLHGNSAKTSALLSTLHKGFEKSHRFPKPTMILNYLLHCSASTFNSSDTYLNTVSALPARCQAGRFVNAPQ